MAFLYRFLSLRCSGSLSMSGGLQNSTLAILGRLGFSRGQALTFNRWRLRLILIFNRRLNQVGVWTETSIRRRLVLRRRWCGPIPDWPKVQEWNFPNRPRCWTWSRSWSPRLRSPRLMAPPRILVPIQEHLDFLQLDREQEPDQASPVSLRAVL